MAQPKLIFIPTDAGVEIIRGHLIDALTDVGLLGPLVTGCVEERFQIGERFFQLISFMGCSPRLRLEPEHSGDEDFCFIRVPPCAERPRFRGHGDRFVPRCPVCRQGLRQWRAHLKAWQEDERAGFVCPNCGHELTMPDVCWRDKAGIGRCFIEVHSVFPHEGIPTPQLMHRMKDATGVDWRYFYEPA